MKLVKGELKDAKDLKKIHVSAYQTSYEIIYFISNSSS